MTDSHHCSNYDLWHFKLSLTALSRFLSRRWYTVIQTREIRSLFR